MNDSSNTPVSGDEIPPLSVAEKNLVSVLMKNGIINSHQLLVAQRYGQENNRDLRQSILELNLISPELLNALAFQQLASLGQGASQTASRENALAALSPDSAKHQKDVRNELAQLAQTAPLTELVNQIFEKAIQCRATDIHLDPQSDGLRIRYRIDGQLQDIVTLETAQITLLISRIKVMSNLNIVEKRHSQDGRITINHANHSRDLRVSTFPTAYGEKLVVRVYESLTNVQSFEQLGMTTTQAAKLTELIAKPYGALLVGGPVGSGKTSTLYNCINKVNLPTRNIMTIEDPIENQIQGVNQSQIDGRSDVTFGEGLKAMLRQDPDVIMIGEIRDDETAKIGIRAALTGVLVFSTIHAADCIATIGNLYNFGVPGYQLSSSLLAIGSQRLIRTVCPYCRVTYQADHKVLAALDLDPKEYDGAVLHRGLGCPACFQTGYLGRTGVFEIMELRDEIRDLIFQQIPKDILRRVAIDMGMQSLKGSAVDKVLEGTTTVEEVYRIGTM